jgi:hypothetical protein
MTAAPVMSITDELVAELERELAWSDKRSAEILAALLAERAELKKCADEMQTIKADMVLDAERYRFLRDLSEQLGNSLFSAVNEWLWGDGPFHDVSEAIDAAMQAAQ